MGSMLKVHHHFLVIILLVIFLCFYPEKEGSGIPEIAGSGPGERNKRSKRKASDLNQLIHSSSSESPLSLRPNYHLPNGRRASDSLKNLDQSDSGLDSGYPTLRKGPFMIKVLSLLFASILVMIDSSAL